MRLLLVCGYDVNKKVGDLSPLEQCIKEIPNTECTITRTPKIQSKFFIWLVLYGATISHDILILALQHSRTSLIENYLKFMDKKNMELEAKLRTRVEELQDALEKKKYISHPGEYFSQLFEQDTHESFRKYNVYKQYLQK